MFANSSQRKVR